MPEIRINMIRSDYWVKARELIEFCNDSELKVLTQQAEKALNKRMSDYLGKFEQEDSEKEKAKGRAIKKRMRQKSNAVSGRCKHA
jgi:hypothetical protein